MEIRGWHLLTVGAVMDLVLLLVLLISGARSHPPLDAASLRMAEENSGGPIRVMRGDHTVYMSTLPLPSATHPRSDGRNTVVWFSSLGGTACRQLERFVPVSAAKFRDRLVLVEKPRDVDFPDGQRLRIRVTPTFVVLDANGAQIARFGFQASARQFEQYLAQLPLPSTAR